MRKYTLWLCFLFTGTQLLAHPMPGSVISLSVLENSIRGEAKIPLIELQNAVGEQYPADLNDPFFIRYFIQHIAAVSDNNQWITRIDSIGTASDQDQFVGDYQEAVVYFTLTPPDARYLRSFTFNYDAVIHQVITHSALVLVRQDWDNGIQEEHQVQQIGAIQLDVPTGKILPLQVNLAEGSAWKGFKSMLSLGMQHIQEGHDHLLFLLVLLLPAMLLTNGRRWAQFGGVRYSVVHLLKIITAFTIGHSVTLLAGAMGWLKMPGQPVEILIAVSILVSAIHALRPLFPGRETFVAAGFGLIHGLAFATVLSNLELGTGKLMLSILGFNLGIELMQLFLIALIVPWLILLSKTKVYKGVRISGALFSASAALAWIVERTTGEANVITGFIQDAAPYFGWGILALAVASLLSYYKPVLFKRSSAGVTV